MTFKARDLGASTAIGRSIPNEGRVVIYKPKSTKGKQMAFGRSSSVGKPITDFQLTIPADQITADIQKALQKHFSNYGGYDSYGRTTAPYTSYPYPANNAPSQPVPTPRPHPTELVGQFGEFYRMKYPPAWIKKGQVSELLQNSQNQDLQTVDKNIKRIVSKAISDYLSAHKGQKLAALVNNVPGATAAITANAKVMINQDPWFQGWGLSI